MAVLSHTRRQFLSGLAASSGCLAGAGLNAGALAASSSKRDPAPAPKAPLRLSNRKPRYLKMPLDDMCQVVKDLGFVSMELVEVEDLPTLKKHGLQAAAVRFPAARGPNGEEVGRMVHAFNRPEFHDLLVKSYEPVLQAVGEFGAPHVMCFSGARLGMDDETALKHCTEGLQKVMPLAEKHGVKLIMELLNSKITHPDYLADHTAWGVELVKRVGSPHFRLLYDIFHMQIMEGDIIATIRAHHESFAHYHCAGVPGRHEIGPSQELNYTAIVRAILETGHRGFIGMEFSPTRKDPLESLREAVTICCAAEKD